MESMGYFSLFGDSSWRIPTPSSRQNQPCNDGGVKDDVEMKKTAHPSQFHNESRKSPTDIVGPREKFNVRLENDTEMKMLLLILLSCILWILILMVALFALGAFSFTLARLFHILAWMLDTLARPFHILAWVLDTLVWRLDTLAPALYTPARVLYGYLSQAFGFAWALLKARFMI